MGNLENKFSRFEKRNNLMSAFKKLVYMFKYN